MSRIEYEVEQVREEVFTGSLILDSYTGKSPEERIYEMMEMAGLSFPREELEFGYEGASDDDGISETMSTDFVVYRNFERKIPYVVDREEIFSGTLILDSGSKRPEDRIYDMMDLAGVQVSSDDELEIGYEGASDDDGISDTMTTEFVVYRLSRKRLEDGIREEEVSEEVDTSEKEESQEGSKEDLLKEIEELKALRAQLESASLENRDKIVGQIMGDTPEEEKMEEVHSQFMVDVLRDQLRELEESQAQLEERLRELQTLYEDTQKEMLSVAESLEDTLNQGKLLSEEELKQIRDDATARKLHLSEDATRYLTEIEQIKKQLQSMKRKISNIKKEIKKVEPLKLTVEEYEEITSTLKKKSIMDAILSRKGMDKILSKKASSRTKEESKKLKAAREEILREISKLKTEEGYSVLEAIEILYDLHVEYGKGKGTPKVMSLSLDEVQHIQTNSRLLPERIISDSKESNYVPGDVPEDLRDVMERDEIDDDAHHTISSDDTTGIVERITLYRDADHEDVYYVHKYALTRFNLVPIGPEIRINGILCNRISSNDADYIIHNSRNNYSPYEVDVQMIYLGNQEDFDDQNMNSEDHPTRDFVERITIFNDLDNDNQKYVNKYVIRRFNLTPVSEEVRIDGIACYPITGDDASYIMGNQNNDYSPYEVVIKDRHLGLRSGMDSDRPRGFVEKITLYRDLDNNNEIYVNKYVVERFGIVPMSDEVRVEGVACFRIDQEAASYIISHANNSYSPYEVDVIDVALGMRNTDMDDSRFNRIEFYRDLNNLDDFYVKKKILNRFNIKPTSGEVNINDDSYFRISSNDAERIIGSAHNHYSPYEIDMHDVDLNRYQKYKENENYHNFRDVSEKIVLYRDLDHNREMYAKKYVVSRFGFNPIGDEVRIDGYACYRISDEDAKSLIENAHNDYSPYMIEIRDVYLNNYNNFDSYKDSDDDRLANSLDDFDFHRRSEGDDSVSREDDSSREDSNQGDDTSTRDFDGDDSDHDSGDSEDEDSSEKEPSEDESTKGGIHTEGEEDTPVEDTSVAEETITLFRDLNDNNQIYATSEVLGKFGISPKTETKMIGSQECFKVSSDTEQLINYIVRTSKNPKYTIKYVDVKLQKKVLPSVEGIIYKLTQDLDIGPRDSRRFRASNLRPTKSFLNELHSGNWVYNVVHFVPSLAKADISFLSKICGSLFLSKRGKNAMLEIQKRLDNLSEEELEVLFFEYKGSRLKTDMNNQINDLIIDRLRKYGLSKVEELNNLIKENYTLLFGLLGQIKAIDEKLESSHLSEIERKSLSAERQGLIQKASLCVTRIIDYRGQADNYLSGGVHGLEEDFKAVSTKLSYVGMRFAKSGHFDNELQKKLADYDDALKLAIANGDDEKIVSSFMGLESCYFDNTKIARSIVGNRSVGSKYYSPLAEQFDYRDDPFIRDLFTTVAISSATISAINAIRVHAIESRAILSQQQSDANAVNNANDATMSYVDSTARNIEGHRGTFQEGMEAQSHQDVLNASNALERESLDMHNWTFGDAYRVTDDAHHTIFNQFHDNVTSSLNQVTSQYGAGAITQAQALQQVADIASGAQSELVNVCQNCLQILRPYAQTHPQFDLGAVQESMEYIVAHPDAIINMNQGMVEVTDLAGGLVGLSAAHVTALSSLPSDMLSTLICAASAFGLAIRVSTTMENRHGKHKGYGNEVTDMMDDYQRGEEEDREERKRHR